MPFAPSTCFGSCRSDGIIGGAAAEVVVHSTMSLLPLGACRLRVWGNSVQAQHRHGLCIRHACAAGPLIGHFYRGATPTVRQRCTAAGGIADAVWDQERNGRNGHTMRAQGFWALSSVVCVRAPSYSARRAPRLIDHPGAMPCACRIVARRT